MYDLKAKDPANQERWFKHFTEASEAYKSREGKCKHTEPTPEPEEETVQELVSVRDIEERADTVEDDSSKPQDDTISNENNDSDATTVEEEDNNRRLSTTSRESSRAPSGKGFFI